MEGGSLVEELDGLLEEGSEVVVEEGVCWRKGWRKAS